jgi:plastocyanin
MAVVRAWSRRALLAAALGGLGLWSVSARAATSAGPTAPASQREAREGTGKPASKTVSIVIDGAVFAPDVVTAQVGDTVSWTNKDIVDHTATATHDEWQVLVKAGKSATLVLKKAGSFDYYCEFHPTMTGRLVVKPSS